MGTPVTCQVCGSTVERGPGGLGLYSHAGKHRRQFRDLMGRAPEDYAEVRRVLGNQPTIDESVLPAEQRTLGEVARER